MEITRGPQFNAVKIASQVLDGIPDFIETGIASVITKIDPGITSKIMGAGNFAIELINSPAAQTLFELYGRPSLESNGVRVNPSNPKTDSVMYPSADSGLATSAELLRSTGVPIQWTGGSYGSFRTCGNYSEYTRPIVTLTNVSNSPLYIQLSPIVEYETGGHIQLTTSTMMYLSQFASSLL